MVTRSTIEDFLAQRSLALVGVSRDGKRGFGNAVRKDLGAKGYEIHLVHPDADAIAGQPCARSLRDVAGRVGGVILVTPPAAAEQLVREAAEAGIRRVWMQQGAESAEAVRFCEEHGIAVVHRECVMMFAEPAGAFHGAHRWLRKVFRGLPK